MTLVPFSSEEPSRIIAWDAERSWWQKEYRIAIFVGESDLVLFNMSLARNRASEKAGNWDVAVILDADTLVSPMQVKTGVMIALESGAVVYPYTERWELDNQGTKKFLS